MSAQVDSLNIETRPSDSPYIERVWRSRSQELDQFISIAVSQCDLVVWKQAGKTYVALHGPYTKADVAPVPQHTEFFGILFKMGAYMPHLPTTRLAERDVSLPDAAHNSFWLNSDTWEIPTFDNAETFVDHLIRTATLRFEPVVDDVLNGHKPAMSLRTVQRRFIHATGLTYRTVQQIERARQAAIRLQEGASILDTVHDFGYFDQPHLNHALKYYIGQTPQQISARAQQLSLLYKTTSGG